MVQKVSKEEVLEVLKEILPAIDWEHGMRLFTDRIMDSLSLVSVVMELSLVYDITFNLDDMVPENMDSLEAITDTVNMLIREKEGRRE